MGYLDEGYFDPRNMAGFLAENASDAYETASGAAEYAYDDPAAAAGMLSDRFSEMHPLDQAALATAPVPVLGDITGLAADARMYYEEPEQRTLANAGMSLAGLLPGVPSMSALMGVRKLSAAEKTAETKRLKALKTPAVRRREEFREGYMFEPESSGQRNIIPPEELQGNVLVPVVGDPSVANKTVTEVGGVPLDAPVDYQGGPGYMLKHQAKEDPRGWASMESAARAKQYNIDKAAEATGLDPVGVYSAMSETSINFSTPVAEVMIGQLAALKPAKKNIEAFNRAVRNKVVKEKGKPPKKPFKDFVGVDDPRVMDQMKGQGDYSMEGAGALRKGVVQEMSKASWRDKGFPIYSDVVRSMTEPDLVGAAVGDAGYGMFKAKPGARLIEDAQHASYNRGIQGEYLGGLAESVPPEIMFPKEFDRLSKTRNKRGRLFTRDEQLGSLRTSHLSEVADQEWLDGIMGYLRER